MRSSIPTLPQTDDYETFFALSLDLLCIANTEGYFVLLNDTWTEVLGWTQAELMSRPYMDFVHPDDVEPTREVARQLTGGHSVIDFENRYRTREGSYRRLQWRTRPGRDGFLFCVVRDITERDQLDRMKDEFIATVSHELRTPLTSIRGSLGLVSNEVVGKISGEARELVDVALANSERLICLVNNILDVESMEADQLPFEMTPHDLVRTVDDAVDMYRDSLETIGIHFQLHVDDRVPELVIFDRHRLLQVLEHLLANAIQFSPPDASITVLVESPEDSDMVRVSVKDCGPGVPLEFRGRVFDKFSQADSSNRRSVNGTGLGLCLARSIIRKHNGHLDFITGSNGSTFYFEIPVRNEPANFPVDEWNIRST